MKDNSFLQEVGERIKYQRKSLSLHQTDLGYHQTQFARYERGESVMNITTLKNICEKLQVSADYLLGLPNMMKDLTSDQKYNIFLIEKLNEQNNHFANIVLKALLNDQEK